MTMLIKLNDNVNHNNEGFGLVGESGSIGRFGVGKDGITQGWGVRR